MVVTFSRELWDNGVESGVLKMQESTTGEFA